MKASSIELLKNSKEPIDILYFNQFISEREYLIGMKFRWLYAQVFGNSQIKAYDCAKVQGRDISKKDTWLEERAQEYYILQKALQEKKYYYIVLNKQPPSFQLRFFVNQLKEALMLIDKVLSNLKIKKFARSNAP